MRIDLKFGRANSAGAIFLLPGLVLASISYLSAQTNSAWEKIFQALVARDAAGAHGHASISFSPAIMSIPGKPFTATRTFTDQRQENGSEVGHPITAEWTIARDDKGRVHYEMAVESESGGKLAIGGFDVEIYDPVAHTVTRYALDGDHLPMPHPTAEVRQLKLMSQLSKPLPLEAAKTQDDSNTAGAPPTPAVANAPEKPAVKFIPTKDNLPPQSIDGIEVVPHRIVLRYGNNLEFLQTEESWLSPEYGMDMRRVVLRETMGVETVETKDVIPGSPDPALFEIPPGYTVSVEH
jgi:hypothetical protein